MPRSPRTSCSCRCTCSSSASRRSCPGSRSRSRASASCSSRRSYGRLADRIGPRRPIAWRALLRLRAPCSSCCRSTTGHERVDVGGRRADALRDRPAGRGRADHRCRPRSGARGPRRGGVRPEPDVGASRRGALGRRGRGARRVGVRAGRSGVGDAPFDPDLVGISRDAGIETFRVVVVSISALAALAAALAATLLRDRVDRPDGLRAERPRGAGARPSGRARPRSRRVIRTTRRSGGTAGRSGCDCGSSRCRPRARRWGSRP